MKSIKAFLRKIDPFGVPYGFKYKDKEKYTSALGGFFIILFIGAALFMGIYYFIPFYNRENYTTVYYTLTMSHTEEINFGKSETAFALGLNCWVGTDGMTADQLLRVDYKYIYYKLEDNEYKKNTQIIGTHPCTKADFYNRYDETFDGSSLKDYQCLDDPFLTVEGIYTSGIFSYFEFDVYAKNSSRELLDKIDAYLLENDCKFQIYYSDNTVDISDYKDPIKSYVEAAFIQINPTLSIRRNIYYMNQYLYDDDFLMWVYGDENAAKSIRTLFSRYEEYSLYQGTTRNYGSSDYLNYVKVYIRADTKRTDVKRKYQKLMEFYADASSLLIALYEILIIIFNFINNFWAEQALSKKIFFFKDLKESGLNVKKRSEQILELLELTATYSPKSRNSKKNSMNDENINERENAEGLTKKDSETIRGLKNEEIQIYNSKKKNNLSQKEKGMEKNKVPVQFEGENEKSRQSGSNENERITSHYNGRDSRSTLNFKYNNMKSKNKNNYNYKYHNYDSDEINESNMETSKDEENIGEKVDLENIEYDFNICDVLGSTIFKCCQSSELKVKYDLNVKANSILYSKLDVGLYVRNMILFDIINETFIGLGSRDIVNFLSRPIISLNTKETNELAIFYHAYKSSDFNKFYNKMNELSQNSDRTREETELISLTNKHLKSLLA